MVMGWGGGGFARKCSKGEKWKGGVFCIVEIAQVREKSGTKSGRVLCEIL